MYKILRKEVLNDVVELMEIHAPYVARKCEPGQFIILRVGEDGERIPLTIADFDREKETITIIYQIVGYSTKELAKCYATLVTQEFCVSRRIPFFEVIDDKENQTRKDEDIGQNGVVEQHAPTIVMDLDRDSYQSTKS